MTEETDFETYLYLSRNKFKIFLFDKKNIKNLFQETVMIENNFNTLETIEASGIGLKNLKRRLALVYSNSHKLSFSTVDNIYKAQLTLNKL